MEMRMKGPGQQNDFAKHSKEMTKDNVPKQMDNNDYGKKRKAKAHKYFWLQDAGEGHHADAGRQIGQVICRPQESHEGFGGLK